MWLWIVLAVIGIICASVFIFINQPSFGSLPQGARLERIKRSPHYRDGQFNNLHPTQMMTSDEGRFLSYSAKQRTCVRRMKFRLSKRICISWGVMKMY